MSEEKISIPFVEFKREYYLRCPNCNAPMEAGVVVMCRKCFWAGHLMECDTAVKKEAE